MKVSIPFHTHRLGLNCGSAPLRDLLEFYGVRFTEAMVFGLGSGMNFGYHHGDEATVPDKLWRAPYWIITGRATFPFVDTCSVLGVFLDLKRNLDNESAWLELKEFLDRGIPVVCDVDREEFLPFINQNNPMTDIYGLRFGGHRSIVIGYDEEANTITFLENMIQEPVTIPLDMFNRLRNTPGALYPSENERYIIRVPEKLQDMRVALKMAIAKTVHKFEYPDYPGMGLTALETWRKEILHWPELMQNEVQLQQSTIMSHTQCTILSGGGMYRKLYAKFLKEADDHLNEPKLVEAARVYNRLVKKWDALLELMMQALQPEHRQTWGGPEMEKLVTEIYDGERQGMDLLRQVRDQWF
jgi:hypothetical protein